MSQGRGFSHETFPRLPIFPIFLIFPIDKNGRSGIVDEVAPSGPCRPLSAVPCGDAAPYFRQPTLGPAGSKRLQGNRHACTLAPFRPPCLQFPISLWKGSIAFPL